MAKGAAEGAIFWGAVSGVGKTFGRTSMPYRWNGLKVHRRGKKPLKIDLGFFGEKNGKSDPPINVRIPVLPEGSQWERNVLNSFAGGKIFKVTYRGGTVLSWYCDFHVYKERSLIECFFNKIKAFRRIAARYDKLASSFLAFVYVAAIWILSK